MIFGYAYPVYIILVILIWQFIPKIGHFNWIWNPKKKVDKEIGISQLKRSFFISDPYYMLAAAIATQLC